jgi:hypothetical protein
MCVLSGLNWLKIGLSSRQHGEEASGFSYKACDFFVSWATVGFSNGIPLHGAMVTKFSPDQKAELWHSSP